MARRIKTARCILHSGDRFLLAVHSSFWGRRRRRWGIPGGQVEWRESPEQAVRRELLEELDHHVGDLTAIGDFVYKHSYHRVLAAPCRERDFDYDSNELLDIGWFDSGQIRAMSAAGELHAGYEWEAIQRVLSLTRST